MEVEGEPGMRASSEMIADQKARSVRLFVLVLDLFIPQEVIGSRVTNAGTVSDDERGRSRESLGSR